MASRGCRKGRVESGRCGERPCTPPNSPAPPRAPGGPESARRCGTARRMGLSYSVKTRRAAMGKTTMRKMKDEETPVKRSIVECCREYAED